MAIWSYIIYVCEMLGDRNGDIKTKIITNGFIKVQKISVIGLSFSLAPEYTLYSGVMYLFSKT